MADVVEEFVLNCRIDRIGDLLRKDIDGLRAVAVLPVVFYRVGFSWFSGGYVGVDVFFVISGYVITRRLLAELEMGRFSITDFYERRIRRIFPGNCSSPAFGGASGL